MKRYLIICVMLLVAVSFRGQQVADPKQPVVCRVLQYHDWLFYGVDMPTVKVMATNHTDKQRNIVVNFTLTTDDYRFIKHDSQVASVKANDSVVLNFKFPLTPGFYRCTVKSETLPIWDYDESGETVLVKKFNIGYDPEKIVSSPDGQPDLKTFWTASKHLLAKVKPHYTFKLLKDSCTALRNLYLVTMKSFGGEEISGYYCTPVKKGIYPADITYMGYGSKPWTPKANDNPNMVEFVLSVRGQALEQPTNKYGDWVTYGLQSKETYYYRGAFMDLIRAIDFICSRSEVDKRNIFAEGGSQGGAFTLAACALDHRIRAAAPWIPFLSDYPDYFKIVHWPAEPILKKQHELGINDADLYRTLSYFDIKNLAGWIECPILMGSGLQDGTCPPHTNFADYNQIKSAKQYRIHPTYGHDVPPSWWAFRMDFFKKYMVK
jgi:cephalosporin-C deacetylase